jgi:hypothetical protein
MSCDCEHEHNHEEQGAATGVANPAVIDLFGLDQERDEVLLVMREDRLWEGSDEQLHDVQEKFNAYASFLLDGEMLAAHPELARKKARIELHSATMPDERGIALLGMIHEQLELQDIGMEVIVADAGGGCGAGCTCHG